MKLAEKKIVLNCGVQGCCPTAEISDNKVLVKDDFGNKVHMSKDQWFNLALQTVEKMQIK